MKGSNEQSPGIEAYATQADADDFVELSLALLEAHGSHLRGTEDPFEDTYLLQAERHHLAALPLLSQWDVIHMTFDLPELQSARDRGSQMIIPPWFDCELKLFEALTLKHAIGISITVGQSQGESDVTDLLRVAQAAANNPDIMPKVMAAHIIDEVFESDTDHVDAVLADLRMPIRKQVLEELKLLVARIIYT